MSGCYNYNDCDYDYKCYDYDYCYKPRSRRHVRYTECWDYSY